VHRNRGGWYRRPRKRVAAATDRNEFGMPHLITAEKAGKHKPGVVQTIHGASHVRLDECGKIRYHRDYWDAADELYAKLPLIEPVMRLLKRRLAQASVVE
jgi:hypothetical protein